MAEDQATSIVPPAEEKHAAPKDAVLGKEPEPVPISTSGPVTGDKVQAAMSEITPKTDGPKTDGTPKPDEKERELKDKSPVGGAEAAPIARSEEKPPPAETVEGAKEDKNEAKEAKAEPEAAKPEAPAANGPAANGPAGKDGPAKEEPAKEEPAKEGPAKEDTGAEEPGAKRAAVNGGEADGPAKKAKTGAPAMNGGRPKGKREKKAPAPVGKTARRTRSQGLGA